MAKFDSDQSAALAAIQQVINEWGDELDQNSGRNIADAGVLSEDCLYFVGGEWRNGIAEVEAFYADRWDRLTNGDGAPVMRHIHSNFRATFLAEDHARVGLLLLFFAKVGTPPFVGYSDPLAVADVLMECRRDPDGHWRISRFESEQIFRLA